MAGTVLQELSIVFDARTDKLAKGLGAVKSAVNGTAGSVEGVGKRFDLLAGSISGAVKAAAGMAAVRKSTEYIKAGIADVFDEIEQTTKLTTVMRQRMNATDGAIQRVLDLADAQKQLGVVDDMVLVAGAQQVSTFLNTSQAVETLLPAMGNLLAQQKGLNATSEDAVSIGNMFGKVMQGQTSALTRVGITFTAAQEQVLLYGNELERAQMLSQVVTDNVGQMSSALGGTLQGRLQQLSNILGDVRKGLGEAFTPIVAAVLPPLTALAKALLFVINCMAKFSAWMAKLFGINIKVASSADGVAGSSADAADAIEKQGAAAGGAAKKTKKLLSTLDQLNEVNKESSGGGGGGGGDKVNDIGAGGAAIDEIADDLADSEASIGELILGAAAWGLAIAGAYRIISPLIRDILGVFRTIRGAIGGASDAAGVLGDVAQTASSVANTAASTAETAAQTAETAATQAGTAAEGVNAAAETISAATSVLSGLGSLTQALGLAAVALAAGTAAGQFGKLAGQAGAAKDAVDAIDDDADTAFTSLTTAAGTAATGMATAMTTAADNAATEFAAMGTAGKKRHEWRGGPGAWHIGGDTGRVDIGETIVCGDRRIGRERSECGWNCDAGRGGADGWQHAECGEQRIRADHGAQNHTDQYIEHGTRKLHAKRSIQDGRLRRRRLDGKRCGACVCDRHGDARAADGAHRRGWHGGGGASGGRKRQELRAPVSVADPRIRANLAERGRAAHGKRRNRRRAHLTRREHGERGRGAERGRRDRRGDPSGAGRRAALRRER